MEKDKSGVNPEGKEPENKNLPGGEGEGTGEGKEPEKKEYTQAEIDAMIAKAKSQVKKKLPSKEEMEAFNAWKAEQEKNKPPEEVNAETLAKYKEAQAELERYKNREKAIQKGVNPDYLDFITYEVSKLVTDDIDFESALDKYLEEHNQFTKTNEEPPKAGGMKQGGPTPKLSGVEKAFYDKNPHLKQE